MEATRVCARLGTFRSDEEAVIEKVDESEHMRGQSRSESDA